jgi:hypothetical protein
MPFICFFWVERFIVIEGLGGSEKDEMRIYAYLNDLSD